MMPALHGGNGLLQNDAMVFHQAAMALADTIRLEGWQAWRLHPSAGMTGNVSLLAILYVVFGPEPALFIPFNAAAHALAAMVLYMLGPKIWPGRVGQLGGVIAAVLWVFFPSALQWYGQNHKDAFSIAGILLLMYVLIDASQQANDLRARDFLRVIGLSLAGASLIAFVRPYYVMVVLLGVVVAALTGTVMLSRNSRCRALNFLKCCLLCVAIVFTVQSETPKDRDVAVSNQASEGLVAQHAQTRDWQWQASGYIPQRVEKLLERVSRIRLEFIAYNYEIGAGSGIDLDCAPDNAIDMLQYMPRAALVGVFSPFPSSWVERPTLPRLIGAIETSVFYIFSIGILGFVLQRKAPVPLFVGLSFSLTMLVILAYLHPNVGTLYRQRYGFWFFLLLCGAAGWVGLAQMAWQSIRKARIGSSIIPDLNEYPGRTLPGLAISGSLVILIMGIAYLGFMVRDLMLVKEYGMSGKLDSFFTASMLLMFFVTAISQPMSDAMTAQFMDIHEKQGLAACNRFAGALFGYLSVIVCILSVVLCALAFPITQLVISSREPEALNTATTMLRWFLPILLLSIWSTIGSGILNALGESKAVTLGQATVPVLAILGILLFVDSLEIYAAILGMVVGCAANIIIIVRKTQKLGVRLAPQAVDMRLLGPTHRKYLRLCGVAALSAVIVPINYYFVGTLDQGALSAWALGNKMVQIAVGLSGVAISAVVLPHLSYLYSRSREAEWSKDIYFLMVGGGWISLILVVLAQIFAEPLVWTLFHGDAINDQELDNLSAILRIGSLQLPFMSAITLLIKFSAVAGVTNRPIFVTVMGLLANVAFNMLWVTTYGVSGVANSMVVSSGAMAICLLVLMRQRVGIGRAETNSLLIVWFSIMAIAMAVQFRSGPWIVMGAVILGLGIGMQWRDLMRSGIPLVLQRASEVPQTYDEVLIEKHAAVSVIIPCYRCEATIDRAMHSIAAQTLLPTEVILVDDCSDDQGRTLAALDRVQAEYRQYFEINIIRLARNSGPGEARNAAWKNAKQPYIAFLDADDSWHPEKLLLQYRWLSQHPEVALCGHATRVAGNEKDGNVTPAFHAVRINKYCLLFSNCLPTRSVMLRREIPFRFLHGQRYSEDYQLWMAILFSGLQGFVLHGPLAYSYKHEFGESGLTANLQSMQQGEVHGYRHLLSRGLIGWPGFTLAVAVSHAKLFRRQVIVAMRDRLRA